MTQQAITITFGECAENHVGMQKIGEQGKRGYTPTEMREMHQQFQNMGVESRLIHLGEDADVLIVPGGVECLLNKGVTSKDLYKELIALKGILTGLSKLD